MRDKRFVAAHRGGPLDRTNHARLARWAADCAERVIPMFVEASDDPRPVQAVEIARIWANGDVRTSVAMKASVGAHAAARSVTAKTAVAAARAAGHAVATAHCADHSLGAWLYAMKALLASGRHVESEFLNRIDELPESLREQVFDGIVMRASQFGIRMKTN